MPGFVGEKDSQTRRMLWKYGQALQNRCKYTAGSKKFRKWNKVTDKWFQKLIDIKQKETNV